MSVLEFFQRIIAFFLLMFVPAFLIGGTFSVFHAIIAIPFVVGASKIARYPFESRFNNRFWVW
jgi:hypothetical protein